MEELNDGFALSPEQQDTASLLERLLGRAIADRYIDFSRLAASATGLLVSRPMAAHALRELESMLRRSLEAPMDAKAMPSEAQSDQLQRATEALRGLGYEENVVESAVAELAPRHNHATQIRLIAERLGLAPDGDIATAWVSLRDTFGRAHERSFHRTLAVDDEFRAGYQRPFELVLRGLVTALQKRYTAFMQRVEALAGMSDRACAVALFEREIPGALPLQWHFFQSISSPGWLPHLLKRNLVSEPLAAGDASGPRLFGEWPVGHYLLAVAKSDDAAAHGLVADAVRSVAASKHPDVRRQGLDVIAALPASSAAGLVDVAVGWLDPDTPNFYAIAPEQLLKKLAEGGHVDAALHLAAALFQVFDQHGQLATLHPQHMYEHHLPHAVNVLAPRNGSATLRLFARRLIQAVTITRKTTDDGDYSDHTPKPIADREMASYGVYEALVIAVRDSALIACQKTSATTSDIISYLVHGQPKILQRIGLHVLAQHAGAAPDLAFNLLADPSYIGEDWCEDEYAELARARFPSLSLDQQQKIFAVIDALPDQYRATWKENFAGHYKRPPTAEDERRYDLSVVRDAMWKWQDVLPPDRKRLIDTSVAELGHPDAWREQLFPRETSPLTGADFSSRPMPEVIAFLKSFQPQAEPVRQTITALAEQLRMAVEQEATRFAEAADQFAGLRPIYVRRFLEGLDTKARNNGKFAWGPVLKLIESVTARLREPHNRFAPADGDDKDWRWACGVSAALLKSGLRAGKGGIPYEHAPQVLSIILTLFAHAPRKPETKDFENQFSNHPYFASEQSLWGSAIELCILFMFWASKQPGSAVAKQPRSALQLLPDIRTTLESALGDGTASGRIPRTILGRYLNWLFYFGEDWLKAQIPILFPDDDDVLRRAAWRGHLINDSGPVSQLMPQLAKSYLEEIDGLGDTADDRDQAFRENRLGDYLLVLYIWDAAPETMMEAFWRKAPPATRQHVIGSLGRQLQLPPEKLPDERRARSFAYWEARLAAALAAPDPDPYRLELGAIGQWCIHPGIEPSWLLDQMARLIDAGFDPNMGYSVVDWLGKIAPDHPDQTVHVLSGLLNSPHANRWTYTAHRQAIRTVLENGLATGTAATVACVRELISFLSTIAETSYLDLVRPTTEPTMNDEP